MELRERKKLVSEAFYQQLREIDFKNGELAVAKGIATITYPDQTRAVIFYSEITKGFGKGEFGADLTLKICGGSIYAALQGTGVEENRLFAMKGCFWKVGDFSAETDRRL